MLDLWLRLILGLTKTKVFWMSYEDLFEYFDEMERTRLFDSDWSLTQKWTTVNVSWSVNYLDTRFQISLAKAGPVVVVLSQVRRRRHWRGVHLLATA